MMATASTVHDRGAKPGFFSRLFGRQGNDLAPLYALVIDEARAPIWYARFAVPDSMDGRFDMMTLVLSLVLLRLEHEHRETESVRLTELFISDMDGQIRESGFGDLVVGKQVGGIMALLGGRLGAYREAVDVPTLTRTLWRGHPPRAEVASAAVDAVLALRHRIDATPLADLLAGRIG